MPSSTSNDPVAALVDDVALTLSDYPDDTRDAALAVYDEMITLLLLGRGLEPAEAARAAAGIAGQVRDRLAGMRGAGRA